MCITIFSLHFRMMRTYKRKTTRGSNPIDVVIRAAKEVEKGSAVRATAMKYGVDRMTLRRFILKKKEPPPSASKEMVDYRILAESKVVIPSEMEKDLLFHIKKLADMFNDLTVRKCCILAFYFAQPSNL